jgi:hypothetical protein
MNFVDRCIVSDATLKQKGSSLNVRGSPSNKFRGSMNRIQCNAEAKRFIVERVSFTVESISWIEEPQPCNLEAKRFVAERASFMIEAPRLAVDAKSINGDQKSINIGQKGANRDSLGPGFQPR